MDDRTADGLARLRADDWSLAHSDWRGEEDLSRVRAALQRWLSRSRELEAENAALARQLAEYVTQEE